MGKKWLEIGVEPRVYRYEYVATCHGIENRESGVLLAENRADAEQALEAHINWQEGWEDMDIQAKLARIVNGASDDSGVIFVLRSTRDGQTKIPDKPEEIILPSRGNKYVFNKNGYTYTVNVTKKRSNEA